MQITFASYNIRKAVGIDGRRDPERILAVLREIDADIIALQEADRRFGTRAAALPRRVVIACSCCNGGRGEEGEGPSGSGAEEEAAVWERGAVLDSVGLSCESFVVREEAELPAELLTAVQVLERNFFAPI